MKPLQLEILGRRKPYVMSHRGNRVRCPENTLESFRQAIIDGADILETDIRLTKDGHFVCIHDATIDRTTNGKGLVKKFSLAEIKQWTASNQKTGFAQVTIPSLEEFMREFSGEAALALELKDAEFSHPEICQRLINLLKAKKFFGILLSFHPNYLKHFSFLAPEIPLGFISLKRFWPNNRFRLQGPFWPLLLLNPLFVFAAHARGQLVCPLDPWPDKRMSLYIKMGCDAVLTDDSEKTVRVLKKLNVR